MMTLDDTIWRCLCFIERHPHLKGGINVLGKLLICAMVVYSVWATLNEVKRIKADYEQDRWFSNPFSRQNSANKHLYFQEYTRH